MLPLAISSSKNDNWFTAVRRTETDYLADSITTAAIPDGSGSYLFGQTSFGSYNRFIYKFDRFGNAVWYKNLLSSNITYLGDACADSLGNVYNLQMNLTGLSATIPVLCINKFSSSGTPVWSQTYYYQVTTQVAPTSLKLKGSYVYTAGHYLNYAYYVKGGVSDGLALSQNRVDAGSTIRNSTIAIDSSQNIYLSISTSSGATLIKFNSSDSVVWQRYIAGINVSDMDTDSSGNIYMTAYTYNPKSGSTTQANTATAYVIKYNSAGSLQWQKNISFSANNGAQTITMSAGVGIRISSDNKIYTSLLISKVFQYFPSQYSSAYSISFPQIACIDSSGSLLWSKTYGVITTPAFDQGYNSWTQKFSIDNNDTLYLAYGQYNDYNGYGEYAGMLKISPSEMVNDASINVGSNPGTYPFNMVLTKNSSSYQTISLNNGALSESAGSLSLSSTLLNQASLTPAGGSSTGYTMSQVYKTKI